MLRSRNYPPSAELADYIARHYVFDADLPQDFVLIDKLLAETAFIRILVNGDWAAETEPDHWRNVGPAVFFGPNSRPMRVRVRGPFRVIGIAIRPCGWKALFEVPADTYTDCMVALPDIWGGAATALLRAAVAANDDESVIAILESAVRARLLHNGSRHVDVAMRSFERIARVDSTARVDDVAATIGLHMRSFERQCLRTFGLMPKLVLRRSRFLDLASAMRGLGSPRDEELAALRFFDQSHLNREFRRFIGMTPGTFARTSTPLLTAGLELRNLRKLETVEE